MLSFSSEDTPLPIELGVTNTIKENGILQFFRSSNTTPPIPLIVNSTTNQLLPPNSFNLLSNTLGQILFKSGTTAIIKKTATYTHDITIHVYSNAGTVGIVAMDIINANANTIKPNAIATKNITEFSIEPLLLRIVHQHTEDDEVQLRFGGGVIPGGGNLQLNFVDIQWLITET
jgi:hypothetical protein